MSGRKIKNMEEFAEVSGISRPTVSKYFHDPNSVRKSTRDRIESALERYEYRPNIFAINQNRKLTKTIGILVPYLADPFFAEMVRNIEQRCVDAGFWPIVFSAYGDRQAEVHALDTLQSLRPAGALIAPLGRGSDHDAVRQFTEEVPTVLFDSNVEGIGEAFVGSDNVQFTGMIVEYLCRSGQPPVFFDMKTPANPNANKRRNGYIRAMESMGHPPVILSVDGEGWDFEGIGFREGLRAIEERRLQSDTVLCSNDRLAIGLIAAAYQKGLRVGRGTGCALRIAGMDDHPYSRFTCPPMTTVAQDYAAISDRSVEAMFAVIERGTRATTREDTFFEGKLIMRDSA